MKLFSFLKTPSKLLAIVCIFSLAIFCVVIFTNGRPKKASQQTTSFYYWKSIYFLSAFEKKYIADHQVEKIYFKAFDITANYSRQIEPVSVMLWGENMLPETEYIPTVFIDYTILNGMSKDSIATLANKTFLLCQQILHYQNKELTEIQLDCDWTASCKQQYFYFVECMKNEKIKVGSTIRLYQYKNPQQAGVPPADYGALMCYNMGNLKDVNAPNSIYNEQELLNYLKGSEPYPLPLSAALPIFSWSLLYNHEGKINKIYNHAPDFNNGKWKQINDNLFQCNEYYEDSISHDYFYNGCQIRVEKIDKATVQQAQKIINNYIPSIYETIYFDLDSTQVATCLQ
jgi:hypothetical protein